MGPRMGGRTVPRRAEAAAKPVTGYAVVVVDAMTVEKSEATKDFEDGWDMALHKGMIR